MVGVLPAASLSWSLRGLIHTVLQTMHEQAKINEAEYFLAQMTALVDHGAASKYELNAFLAAARSSLQYALKEAKPKTSGQAWYNAQVPANPP